MWHASKQIYKNPSASVAKILSNAYEAVMKEDSVPCGMSAISGRTAIRHLFADLVSLRRLCDGVSEQL